LPTRHLLFSALSLKSGPTQEISAFPAPPLLSEDFSTSGPSCSPFAWSFRLCELSALSLPLKIDAGLCLLHMCNHLADFSSTTKGIYHLISPLTDVGATFSLPSAFSLRDQTSLPAQRRTTFTLFPRAPPPFFPPFLLFPAGPASPCSKAIRNRGRPPFKRVGLPNHQQLSVQIRGAQFFKNLNMDAT